ncbi:MAG: hypothetical protein CMJ29_13380 [Phycisphaerae bacterium]|nr:hypothetical protein [Phycisphaerae bacterium]
MQRSSPGNDLDCLVFKRFRIGTSRRFDMLETLCLITLAIGMTDLPMGWKWDIEPTNVRVETNECVQLGETGTLVAHWNGDQFTARFIQSMSESDEEGNANGRSDAYMLAITTDEGTTQYNPQGTMGNPVQTIFMWSNAKLDPSRISTIGVLRRTEQGLRSISRNAMDQAASEGVEVMPLAIKGAPFAFDLPTLDGNRIASEDLKGQFVLIDNWATWCGPCMAKMPELKKLHDTWGGKGLQIIGIDWDSDIAKGKLAIERESLYWPQVNPYEVAPDHIELWNQASGIDALPYLVLLDVDGTVITSGAPEDVMSTTEDLMYLQEEIKSMTPSQIRRALLNVSEKKNEAQNNSRLKENLTRHFNMLMKALKDHTQASPNPPLSTPPLYTLDQIQMLEQIQKMSEAEIRWALVETSNARQEARNNREMQDKLTMTFNMLMNALKDRSSNGDN